MNSRYSTPAEYEYRSQNRAIFNSDAGDLTLHTIGPLQASPSEHRSGNSDQPDSSSSLKRSESKQLHVPRLHPFDVHDLQPPLGKGSDIPIRTLRQYRGGVLSQLLHLYKPTMGAISGHHHGWSPASLEAGSAKIRGRSTLSDGSSGSRANSSGFNCNIPDQ